MRSIALVVLAAGLVASTTRAQGAPTTLEGMVVWDAPITSASPEVRDAWRDARALLRDHPRAPRGRSLEAISAWRSSVLSPWLMAHREALASLDGRLARLGGADDARAQLFASVLHAQLQRHFLAILDASPRPREIERDAALAALHAQVLDRALVPILDDAAGALRACARLAPSAPEPMRADGARCEQLATELEERAARARASETTSETIGTLVGADTPPAACSEGLRVPRAVAPVTAAPELAVVAGPSLALAPPALARVVEIVRRALAGDAALHVLARAEVDAAERLADQRRWRRGGPVCARGPTRDDALAAAHADLALAEVSARYTSLGLVPDDPPRAELSVSFRRVDSLDTSGLPDARSVTVSGSPPTTADWIAAARRLWAASETEGAHGVLGVLDAGAAPAREAITFAGIADEDVSLEADVVLADAREALARCFTGRGVARFAITLTLAADGSVSAREVDVQPDTLLGAASDVERARACVAEAVATTRWPCPPAEGTTVTASVCLAGSP